MTTMMHVDIPSHFMCGELFRTVCGAVLGRGAARTVYEHAFDPTLVIKFEHNAGSFQNISEWQAWEAIKWTDLAQWFAPCVTISPNGAVLVQKRTRACIEYPDLIPAFLTDLKTDNFGMLGKQFVAHDYGLHLLLERGMTKRMQKAQWNLP